LRPRYCLRGYCLRAARLSAETWLRLIEAALFATLAAILLAVAVWQLRRRVG
jgi:hypothetical protein